MTRHDLIDWVKEHPGRAAAMGGAVVVALVLLMVLMVGGGDVAPTVVTQPSAEAGNTPGATGTAQVHPDPNKPQSAPAATSDPNAVGNTGPSTPNAGSPTPRMIRRNGSKVIFGTGKMNAR